MKIYKSLFILFIVTVTTAILFTGCKKSDGISDPYLIKLATSTTLGKYLTDKDGNTLYFFSDDANGANNCTGGCISAWPIFNVDGLTQEKLGEGLHLADFSTINSDNGVQVTYKGWPLYYYAPSGVREKAGVTSGDGVGGNWFIAKTDYTIMIAKAQLVGADGKNYLVSADNVYTEGIGKSVYFTDLAGRTLYAFKRDSFNINKYTKVDFSNNTVWPIYETDVAVVPSTLNAALFSSIMVYGRKQLTYKGRPMYYYASDVDAATGFFRGFNKGVSAGSVGLWPILYDAIPEPPKKL